MSEFDFSNKLITDCISNNRRAQKRLYEKLLPYLNAIVKRYLHDESHIADVLQESFVRIFKYLKRFDARKSSFKTWVTAITINRCLSQNESVRKNQQMRHMINETASEAPKVLQKLYDEEFLVQLKKMPLTYYEVFNLFMIEEYSHKEISQMLNIDSSLSRKRLSRAKIWIKQNFKDAMFTSFSNRQN